MNPFEQFSEEWKRLQAHVLDLDTWVEQNRQQAKKDQESGVAAIRDLDAKIAAVKSKIDGDIARVLTALDEDRARVARLKGEADVEGINQRIKTVGDETHRRVVDAQTVTLNKVEETLAGFGQSHQLQLDALRREVTSLRGELQTVRQEVGELHDAYTELLKDWSRFKRVMEGRRLG